MEEDFEIEFEGQEDENSEELFELTEPVEYDEENHYENLVPKMGEECLEKIGFMVASEFEDDKASRQEWEMLTSIGLEKLGLQTDDPSNLPFEGACDVQHPIILESVISYQSRTTKELLPPKGPVKTKILGRATPEREAQAERVKRHMNWQLTQQMPEYWDNTQNMLFYLALVGNGFKKKYYDETKQRIVDEHIFPTDIYVNSMATSIADADRVTQVIRLTERQMEERLYNETYHGKIADLGDPATPQLSELEEVLRQSVGLSANFDKCYELLEQQRYLPLNDDYKYDDDVPLRPYIVTIELGTHKVLSIRRGWCSYSTDFKRFDYISHYKFVPGGSFYAFGFVHLLGNLQKTLTATIRSLMDAGQFANMRAGYKKKNVRIQGGNDEPHSPGEIKDVHYSGENLRDAFFMLEHPEPSQVMQNLYTILAGETRTFADSTQQVISESTNYGPVGTTMALLEGAAKFFAAIHMRAHQGQKHELETLFKYNFEFLDDFVEISVVEDLLEVSRDDYDPNLMLVVPVSDPNDPSQAQRIARARDVLSMALQAPDAHNLEEVYIDFYSALDVENAERYMKVTKKAQPQGPLDDIMDVVRGEAIKAFPGQDHRAHMMFKMAWLEDPSQGSSPLMKQFAPLIMANIREHQLLDYAAKMEAIQAQEQLSQEQAAQRLSELHKAEAQVAAGNDPASMIARAEMMDAETNAKKEERMAAESKVKIGNDLMKTAMQLEKEKTKALQENRKFELAKANTGHKMVKDGFDTLAKWEASKKKPSE